MKKSTNDNKITFKHILFVTLFWGIVIAVFALLSYYLMRVDITASITRIIGA